MAKLMKPDGSVTDVKPARGKEFTLRELQDLVGGYIQIIPVGDRLMVMDEEGKLKQKPLNECATERAAGYLFPGDYISGDALLCEEGEVS